MGFGDRKDYVFTSVDYLVSLQTNSTVEEKPLDGGGRKGWFSDAVTG